MLRHSCLLALVLAVGLVSAQSCFTAPNKRAGSSIVPCADPRSGYSACCQLGDLCLSDSACWNPQYNVTYLYGCNDPTYQDPSCPYKCGPTFADKPYVGLDYCYNFTRNEWSCTHPPGYAMAIEPFNLQECHKDSIIAFAGPKSLQPILSLPMISGESTVYFSEVNPTSYTLVSGYTPSPSYTIPASVPTAPESVGAKTTSSSQTITGSSTTKTGPPITQISNPIAGIKPTAQSSQNTNKVDSSNVSGGLSSGTKIAIGVGVTFGILLILAILALIVLWRRRHSSRHISDDSEAKKEESDSDKNSGEHKRESLGYDHKAELSGTIVPHHYSQNSQSKIELDTPRISQRWSSATPITWSPDGTLDTTSDATATETAVEKDTPEPVERFELACTKD